ncbi:hypothetical protein [uncultured Clostridium sp.]|uniref:hypothetical protein n=1 Tax=uncultured Clostridium sp. TaxID=59620 RepID=UPI0025EDCD7D|nr:hypothetical protein [uncultured Clostridium sp.]
MITNEEYLMKHVRKAERDLKNTIMIYEECELTFSENIKFIISDEQIETDNKIIVVGNSYFNNKSRRKYDKELISKLQYDMICIYLREEFFYSTVSVYSNTSPAFISIILWFNSRNRNGISINMNPFIIADFQVYNNDLYKFATDKSTIFSELLFEIDIMIDNLEKAVYKIHNQLMNTKYNNTIRKCEISYSNNNLDTICQTTYFRDFDNSHIVERTDRITLGMDIKWSSDENELHIEEVLSIVCGLSNSIYQKIA